MGLRAGSMNSSAGTVAGRSFLLWTHSGLLANELNETISRSPDPLWQTFTVFRYLNFANPYLVIVGRDVFLEGQTLPWNVREQLRIAL